MDLKAFLIMLLEGIAAPANIQADWMIRLNSSLLDLIEEVRKPQCLEFPILEYGA